MKLIAITIIGSANFLKADAAKVSSFQSSAMKTLSELSEAIFAPNFA